MRYARQKNLFAQDGGEAGVRDQRRGAIIGLSFHAIALVIAFFSGIASVALILAVAVWYAVAPAAQG